MDQKTEVPAYKGIRMSDIEAGEMLSAIASHYKWSEGNVASFLIRQEYARLFNQPRNDVPITKVVSEELLSSKEIPVDGRVFDALESGKLLVVTE